MSTRSTIGAVVVALVLIASGCSNGDGDAGKPGTSTTEQAAPPPNPCTLLDAGTLTRLTEHDHGKGKVKALAPDQRSVCSFGDGLSLAVEIGSGFDATVKLIRASPSGATVSDVDGVGSTALWQDFGNGTGQLIANGDAYFVGVTVVTGGREVAQAVATAMLAAL